MANSITTATTAPTNVGAPVRVESQPQTSESAVAERQPVAGGGNTAPISKPEVAQVSAQELAQATRDISDYIQSVSRSLQISVDGDLGSTVIRVLNPETDEVIRQIPSEEALALARYLAEQRAVGADTSAVRGILFNNDV